MSLQILFFEVKRFLKEHVPGYKMRFLNQADIKPLPWIDCIKPSLTLSMFIYFDRIKNRFVKWEKQISVISQICFDTRTSNLNQRTIIRYWAVLLLIVWTLTLFFSQYQLFSKTITPERLNLKLQIKHV